MTWISRSFVVLLLSASLAAGRNQVATEHFVVVFEDGLEYWAHEVIRAAEDVWDDLMAAYDIQDEYKPVYIYVEDGGDYATGYTYPSRNHVTIGTTALDIDIRSSDNWIRNVVTHELGHVFSIKAANKDGFLKNWWIGRSSAYQNPNIGVAFHYRDLQAPKWWLEGLAQYEAYKNGNDRWDTHRDMFLRMAALENDLLDYAEMSVFDSRHGFYPEMTYNQGYSMMLYIDSVYGSEAVRTTAKTKSLVSFNRLLRAGTGQSGQNLYSEWKKHITTRYRAQTDEVRADQREGRMVFDGGYWDFHGTYSPDGSSIALISNKGYDVLFSHAYLYRPKTNTLERLDTRNMRTQFGHRTHTSYTYTPGNLPAPRRLKNPSFRPHMSPDAGPAGPASRRSPAVLSRIGWSPDGTRLCYSRSADGSAYRDIYIYDVQEEREHRITWQARAKDPAFSPDGNTIACIVNDKGTNNLALVAADGRALRLLTNFNAGTQLFAPCWTPDGKKIILGILQGSNRDIAIVDASAEPFDRTRALTDTTFFPDSVNYQKDLNLLLVVHTAADERDPCISPDGRYLYYSSDRTGIFNIYRMSLETWEVEQITNVLGGAFSPSVHPNGTKLLYTGFHAADFNLYELNIAEPESVKLTYVPRTYRERYDDPFLFSKSPGKGQYPVAPYKPRFTLWWFEPYLAWQPTYVTDTVGISQLRTGVSLVGGELRGNLSMGGSAYISKDFRDGAGPSWGGDLVFGLRVPSIFGENRDLVPEAQVFGSHEVIRNENAFSTDYHPTRTDFTKTPPNDFSLFVEPDTLIGVYSDLFEGVFHDERAFTQYGISAGLSLNRSNQLGLYYARLRDHYSGSYYGYRSRRLGRLLLSDSERFEDVVDLTGAELADPNQQAAVDSWERWIHHEVADTTPSRDLVDYFDRFSIYADHRVGLSYQFTNVRPRFGVPARVDYISLGGQFTRGALTIDSYYGDGDTVIEHGDDRELFVRFDPSGNQIPHLTPVEETRDFFKVELAALERFPLPGNRLMGEWPRGARGGHFCTVNLFLGSLNRRLPSEANTWPLQYRIAQFMKAYPYAFDPVDLGTVEYPIAVDRMDSRGNYLGPDTLLYTYLGDTHHEDIMWGNGIFYGSIEYTLEILRGANLHGPGLMLRGLYITPFLEWSKLWNGDWSDLEIEVDRNEPPWEWVTYHGTKRPLLRDWGVRTELALVMATVWNASLSFTWARRLDLDSALLDYEQTGNRVTKTYLDKDRFSVGLHVW